MRSRFSPAHILSEAGLCFSRIGAREPLRYQPVNKSQRSERKASRNGCATTPALLLYPASKIAIPTLEEKMAWTTPTLVEICIGLEINGYLPAEF